MITLEILHYTDPSMTIDTGRDQLTDTNVVGRLLEYKIFTLSQILKVT
jgi:hypothetical protein